MSNASLNVPSATEECHELSGKRDGIVREFNIVWRMFIRWISKSRQYSTLNVSVTVQHRHVFRPAVDD